MTELFEFLNTNSGALNVLFSSVVTVATTIYAVLTWRLVTETRLMREVQTEPKLVVSLQSIDEAIHIVRLHFKNIGLGPALHVKFTPRVDDGNDQSKALLDEFTQPNFFRTGLTYLGPGQERVSMYTQLSQGYEAKLATVLAFDIEYKSATGKGHKDTLVVDMSEYKGTHQLGKPHLYSMAKSLEKIEKEISKLTGGSRRLQTDTFDSDDRAQERAELEAWRDEQRLKAGSA